MGKRYLMYSEVKNNNDDEKNSFILWYLQSQFTQTNRYNELNSYNIYSVRYDDYICKNKLILEYRYGFIELNKDGSFRFESDELFDEQDYKRANIDMEFFENSIELVYKIFSDNPFESEYFCKEIEKEN